MADENMMDAVKAALEKKGTLSSIKSKIRAEVFNALEGRDVPSPALPQDVFLVAQLVLDFCDSLGLDNTVSVFSTEIGSQPDSRVSRNFLFNELGFKDNDSNGEPLLLILVNYLRLSKKERAEKAYAALEATKE